MKKLMLTIAAAAAISLSANAQTEKGKIILGGSASYQSVKSDADGAKAAQNISVVPNIGVFVNDDLALGTGIGYSYSKIGSASATGLNQSFVVSPFGRYYVGLSDQFKFFGQASVPLAFGTVKSTDANGDAGAKVGSSTSVGVALSPGFAYFPTRKIGVEFAFSGLSYNNYKVEDGDGNQLKGAGSESFAIGTSFFTPQIGIQFHF
jgi:opacity protein-like surface antigen